MKLRIIGAAALCTAVAAIAHAGDGKTITFTTKSEEARQQAAEAVRLIETFHPGPQIQESAKKAVAADPDFAWAHYLLAASTFPQAQAKPEHDKALELVAKASPGEQKYLAAIKLNREQKGQEALEAFKQLRVEYPDERMVHMMVGQISLNQGQFAEAQTAFEKAIALDDSTPRAHALIGNVLVLKGEYAQARTHYDAAMAKRAPGTAPGGVFYPRSLSYLYEGKVDDALAGLKAFLGEYKQNKLDATLPEVFIWNSIARINLENGRLEEAMKAYRRASSRSPAASLDEENKKIWLGRLHHGTRPHARAHGQARGGLEGSRDPQEDDRRGRRAGEAVRPRLPLHGRLPEAGGGRRQAALEHLKQAEPDAIPSTSCCWPARTSSTGDKESAKKAYGEIVAFNVNNLERALAYPEARRSGRRRSGDRSENPSGDRNCALAPRVRWPEAARNSERPDQVIRASATGRRPAPVPSAGGAGTGAGRSAAPPRDSEKPSASAVFDEHPGGVGRAQADDGHDGARHHQRAEQELLAAEHERLGRPRDEERLATGGRSPSRARPAAG